MRSEVKGMTPPSNFDGFFWLSQTTDARKIETTTTPTAPIEETDDWLSGLWNELQVPVIIKAITTIADKILKNPLVHSFSFCITTHIITRLAKKLCEGYTFVREIEELGLRLTNEFPHLHLVAAATVWLFSSKLPLLSTITAGALGILSGINFEVISLETVYQALRLE